MSRADIAREKNEAPFRGQRFANEAPAPEGYEWGSYTLWGADPKTSIRELIPKEDLIGTIVEGTGRQDWRKLRPFDLLPDVDLAGGVAYQPLYTGDILRIACDHVVGSQERFERAGDFQTIFIQFSGISVVETSFGVLEIWPGEALLVPAMVAHRTTGTANCRRMIYTTKHLLEPNLFPEDETTDIHYWNHRVGDPEVEPYAPTPRVPADGKILEHLTMWDGRPGEDYLIRRTYDAMVGKATAGQRPHKCRPFNHYLTAPDDPTAHSVRSSTLWENDTFRQRTYANPGKQPATHRGYDEEEFWFQFAGAVFTEGEHGAYYVAAGETSMAEAGIAHQTFSKIGCLRFTTYCDKPIRMVADPNTHVRESQWELRETIIRGWSRNGH